MVTWETGSLMKGVRMADDVHEQDDATVKRRQYWSHPKGSEAECVDWHSEYPIDTAIKENLLQARKMTEK